MPKPNVKTETKFAYKDTLDGNAVEFKPAGDEIVVTFQDSNSDDAIESLRKRGRQQHRADLARSRVRDRALEQRGSRRPGRRVAVK